MTLPPVELPDLTDDAFLGGSLAILQPATGYRAGIDAVLLAAVARSGMAGGGRVLDAGAGVGVVGIAIAARVTAAQVTLVEIDPVLAELARRNAARNGLDARVRVVMADATDGGRVLQQAAPECGLVPGTFDHVVSNPPYYAEGSGTPSPLQRKATAHQMREGGLDRWIAFLATAAKSNGALTLIHRADALGLVLQALDGRFGRVQVRPVHPRVDQPASRILVTAIKGSRAPLELRPSLVLQDSEGRYLPKVEAVLRRGEPLEI